MSWFNCRHKRSLVECRLICFPWSGGGTGFFSAWGAHFPDTIEVVGIRLPGRESRMDEPLITNITELSEQVAEEIYKNYKDEPFAFFGHSMGLITSFHTALTLQKKYDIKPVALFVSGTFAPNSAVRKIRIADPTYARWSQLNDDDLIDVVENLGGTSPELLEDKEFMKKIFLPPFRADLAVTEFYYHDSTKTPPLSCKVVSLDGDEDREHNQEDFRHLTSASFEKLKFPGKHFYLLKEDNVRGVANLISDALRGLKIEEQEACALDYFD